MCKMLPPAVVCKMLPPAVVFKCYPLLLGCFHTALTKTPLVSTSDVLESAESGAVTSSVVCLTILLDSICLYCYASTF